MLGPTGCWEIVGAGFWLTEFELLPPPQPTRAKTNKMANVDPAMRSNFSVHIGGEHLTEQIKT
jgi:hypothetical protein